MISPTNRKETPANSQLVQDDPHTNQTYQTTGFNPATTTTTPLSYTSARVMKPAYNTYATNNFKVFGYYTDWSQYDARLDGTTTPSQAGRGYDMAKVNAKAYDKIVLGFVGILGDTGEKAATINKGAQDFGITLKWSSTFTDSWGDVLSYRNCGFPGWVSNDPKALYNQNSCQGALGGLRLLRQQNPNLALSISIGGWTMSEAFHFMAKSSNFRTTFVNSVADIYTRFPMLNEIDIDWEYPSYRGHPQNNYDDTDAENFALLIKELKAKFVSMNRSDIIISAACIASVEGLEKANVPALINYGGLDAINLMTYDFFGTGWSEKLAHHTNLRSYSESNLSIESAVDYLLDHKVPAKKIYIGFAGYSRNAADAILTSYSPLKGFYNQSSEVTGMFETGVSEYSDILYNYMDFEGQVGRNGFKLYTDPHADADYLYSQSSRLFISLDTPRSIKNKGQYVVSKGLGGMFTWTIDQDRGLLVNAAREGLGCEAISTVVDMSKFYFTGNNC